MLFTLSFSQSLYKCPELELKLRDREISYNFTPLSTDWDSLQRNICPLVLPFSIIFLSFSLKFQYPSLL